MMMTINLSLGTASGCYFPQCRRRPASFIGYINIPGVVNGYPDWVTKANGKRRPAGMPGFDLINFPGAGIGHINITCRIGRNGRRIIEGSAQVYLRAPARGYLYHRAGAPIGYIHVSRSVNRYAGGADKCRADAQLRTAS